MYALFTYFSLHSLRLHSALAQHGYEYMYGFTIHIQLHTDVISQMSLPVIDCTGSA